MRSLLIASATALVALALSKGWHIDVAWLDQMLLVASGVVTGNIMEYIAEEFQQ